jgi:hypothetical protein
MAAIVMLLLAVAPGAGAEDGAAPRLAIDGADGEVRAGDHSLKIAGVDTSAWPALRIDFSIANRAEAPFDALRASNVAARHDGAEIPVGEGDLVLQRGGPTSVLLMLDGSLSMKSGGPGISKLGAARGALLTFVEKMGPKDRAAFGVFAESTRLLVPFTSDKKALTDAIATFMPNPAESRYTRLYDGVEWSIREASRAGVRNVVLMSDGWEDTPESRELMKDAPAWAARKAEREAKLAELSRGTGVRVFTIALGDRQGTGLAYVDHQALTNVSKGSDGGTSDYVDLPELDRKAKGDLEAYKRLFLETLGAVFAGIGGRMRYDYSLTLRLPDGPRDDRDHVVDMEFVVGKERLPAVVTYTWRGTAIDAPVVTSRRVLPGILISTPAAEATRPRLTVVFAFLLALLGALAAAGRLGRLIHRRTDTRAGASVVSVSPRSALVGRECPNERDGFGGTFAIKAGDAVVVCDGCGTAHHAGCWHMNRDTCWNRACEHEAAISPDVARRYEIDEVTV